MERLPQDLLRYLFSFLSPLEYRSFSQTCTKTYQASLLPLRRYFAIYEGKHQKTKLFWMIKISNKGIVEAMSISSEPNLSLVNQRLEVFIDNGNFELNFSCPFSFDGFLEGEGSMKAISRSPNICDNRMLPFVRGKLDGYEVSTLKLRPLNKLCMFKSSFYEMGLPPESFRMKYDKFCLGYIPIEGQGNTLTTIRDNGLVCVKRCGRFYRRLKLKGKFKSKRLDFNEILYHLPKSISGGKKIPIRSTNIRELILPLRIAGCWNRTRVSEEVNLFIQRLCFYVFTDRFQINC